MPTPARLAASAGSWKWDLGVGSCLLGAASWELEAATCHRQRRFIAQISAKSYRCLCSGSHCQLGEASQVQV